MDLYLTPEEILLITRALQTELSERIAIGSKYGITDNDLNIDLIQSILEKINQQKVKQKYPHLLNCE